VFPVEEITKSYHLSDAFTSSPSLAFAPNESLVTVHGKAGSYVFDVTNVPNSAPYARLGGGDEGIMGVWSADGAHLAFSTKTGSVRDLYYVTAEGGRVSAWHRPGTCQG
jgi:hypothetical protein